MNEKDKKEKTVKDFPKKADLWSGIDTNEILETSKLEILPSFNKLVIKEKDFNTVKHVVIAKLPYAKYIEKVGRELLFMEVICDGIRYSLPADSIALRRSLISLAIKECEAKEPSEIDINAIVGKTYAIKRREFTSKSGFISSPLQFFPISSID